MSADARCRSTDRPDTRRPGDRDDRRVGGGRRRRVAALAGHRHGVWALAAVAFADSSFLPVPPDLLLVPMALIQPARLWRFLGVCTVGSSLGAVLGYLIGFGLWNAVGQQLVQLYGCAEAMASFQRLVAEWGVWIIIGKAFTPIPFKIAAIGAGVTAMNPLSFLVAAVVGRALHFAIIGALLAMFGARAMALVQRYERPLAIAAVLLLAGIVAAYWLR